MGAHLEGEKVPQTFLFLIGLPLGTPGTPKVAKLASVGATMLPGDPNNNVLGRGGGVGRSHLDTYVCIYIYIYIYTLVSKAKQTQSETKAVS